MTVEQVAWGIHQIVNENMANAARAHLGERGKDPRRMPMYAFGGAGPVHGYRVAEILRLPALISPFGAGVGSTFGLLAAPLAFDFVRSAYSRLDELDWQFANGLLDEMAEEGRKVLESSGLTASEITYQRTADMRYVGQGHEVSVALPDGVLERHTFAADRGCIRRDLPWRYMAAKDPTSPLEVINWRVVASGPRPEMNLKLPRDSRKRERRAQRFAPGLLSRTRRIMWRRAVYDRYALEPGMQVRRPGDRRGARVDLDRRRCGGGREWTRDSMLSWS